MQYKINFTSESDIILPFQYSQILQASLLKMLSDENYAYFIHNVGYTYEKRNYKLYTYSRIMGKAQVDKQNKRYNFKKRCALYVSSMDDKFMHYIFNEFLESNKVLRWQNNFVRIESIEVLERDAVRDSNRLEVKTVSPITTYSTLYGVDGTKKLYYYSPYEKEFQENVASNLKKKYFAYYNQYPEQEEFVIRPMKEIKECVLTYKGTLIKGYTGIYELKGSKEMLCTALDAGLGSRNSIGFGMALVYRR